MRQNGLDGTSPAVRGVSLSSEPVSSFPNRKLNLRFGFSCKICDNLSVSLRLTASLFCPFGTFPPIGESAPGRGAFGRRRKYSLFIPRSCRRGRRPLGVRSGAQTTKSASLPGSMEPISASRPIWRAGMMVAERDGLLHLDAEGDRLLHAQMSQVRGRARDRAVGQPGHCFPATPHVLPAGCTARPACRSSAARRR